MATVIYTFNASTYVGGERKDSADPEAVQMSTGDYGSYDTATQQFTLYPSAGAFAIILYVPQPVVTALATVPPAPNPPVLTINGPLSAAPAAMSVAGSLPGGLPTAH